MRKFIVFFALACQLCYFPALAQKTFFAHSAGVAFYGATDYFSGGLMYSPRINVAVLSERSTFSIGTHLGLGGSFGYDYNAYDGGASNSVSVFIDLPLMVEYNFGNAATRIANTKFGGFVGAGYGWHRLVQSIDTEFGAFTSNTTSRGPVVNAGFRFPIGRASFGVRGAYLINTDEISVLDGVGSLAFVYNIGTKINRR